MHVSRPKHGSTGGTVLQLVIYRRPVGIEQVVNKEVSIINFKSYVFLCLEEYFKK